MIRDGISGRDSVVGMLMPGEVVVPTSMVKAGAVDHLRGKLPGFASGGQVGGTTNNFATMAGWAPGFTSEFTQTFTSAMESSMTSAMKAAQAAAVSSLLHPTGSGGSVEQLMRSMAASVGWVEQDLERLRAELPAEGPPAPGDTFRANFVFKDRRYTCQHQHRTEQAAVECARRMAREIARQLGMEHPKFEYRRDGEAEWSPVWPPPSGG